MVLLTEALVYAFAGLVMAVMFVRRARSGLSYLNKLALCAGSTGLFASARLVTAAESANAADALVNQVFAFGIALTMIGLFREAWRSPQIAVPAV